MGSEGSRNPGIWKDKVFWILATGGLVAYLLGIFAGTEALLLGDVLWVLAFVYLLFHTFKKR
ncbi:hypothetical protein JCM16138_06900 [Thermococcus atlanticus]